MATSGGGKKGKKSKWKSVALGDILPNTVIRSTTSWADEVENELTADTIQKITSISLPTAPRAACDVFIDESQIPSDGPFIAYLSNLPYEISEDDISQQFKDLQISEIQLPKDSRSDRMRGFGYVQFKDKSTLISVLHQRELTIKGRTVRISLASEDDKDKGSRSFGGGSSSFTRNRDDRSDGPDKTVGDWRANSQSSGAHDSDKGTYRVNRRDYGGGSRFDDRDKQSSVFSRAFGGRDGERNRGFKRYDREDRSGGGAFDDRRSGGAFDDRRSGGAFDDRRSGGFFGRKPGGLFGGRDDFKKSGEELDRDPELKTRPKLQVMPRTIKPDATPDEPVAPSSIFGGAKPVDTAAREREIEEKLSKVLPPSAASSLSRSREISITRSTASNTLPRSISRSSSVSSVRSSESRRIVGSCNDISQADGNEYSSNNFEETEYSHRRDVDNELETLNDEGVAASNVNEDYLSVDTTAPPETQINEPILRGSHNTTQPETAHNTCVESTASMRREPWSRSIVASERQSQEKQWPHNVDAEEKRSQEKPWSRNVDTQEKPWSRNVDTQERQPQEKPWSRNVNTQEKPWSRNVDTQERQPQEKPWSRNVDAEEKQSQEKPWSRNVDMQERRPQEKPWSRSVDTQEKPWSQNVDTQERQPQEKSYTSSVHEKPWSHTTGPTQEKPQQQSVQSQESKQLVQPESSFKLRIYSHPSTTSNEPRRNAQPPQEFKPPPRQKFKSPPPPPPENVWALRARQQQQQQQQVSTSSDTTSTKPEEDNDNNVAYVSNDTESTYDSQSISMGTAPIVTDMDDRSLTMSVAAEELESAEGQREWDDNAVEAALVVLDDNYEDNSNDVNRGMEVTTEGEIASKESSRRGEYGQNYDRRSERPPSSYSSRGEYVTYGRGGGSGGGGNRHRYRENNNDRNYRYNNNNRNDRNNDNSNDNNNNNSSSSSSNNNRSDYRQRRNYNNQQQQQFDDVADSSTGGNGKFDNHNGNYSNNNNNNRNANNRPSYNRNDSSGSYQNRQRSYGGVAASGGSFRNRNNGTGSTTDGYNKQRPDNRGVAGGNDTDQQRGGGSNYNRGGYQNRRFNNNNNNNNNSASGGSTATADNQTSLYKEMKEKYNQKKVAGEGGQQQQRETSDRNIRLNNEIDEERWSDNDGANKTTAKTSNQPSTVAAETSVNGQENEQKSNAPPTAAQEVGEEDIESGMEVVCRKKKRKAKKKLPQEKTENDQFFKNETTTNDNNSYPSAVTAGKSGKQVEEIDSFSKDEQVKGPSKKSSGGEKGKTKKRDNKQDCGSQPSNMKEEKIGNRLLDMQ